MIHDRDKGSSLISKVKQRWDSSITYVSEPIFMKFLTLCINIYISTTKLSLMTNLKIIIVYVQELGIQVNC